MPPRTQPGCHALSHALCSVTTVIPSRWSVPLAWYSTLTVVGTFILAGTLAVVSAADSASPAVFLPYLSLSSSALLLFYFLFFSSTTLQPCKSSLACFNCRYLPTAPSILLFLTAPSSWICLVSGTPQRPLISTSILSATTTSSRAGTHPPPPPPQLPLPLCLPLLSPAMLQFPSKSPTRTIYST
ncbi:uncharacterized protein ASCRUDRAFT_106142 [Ascoidea rubescens DSM 1968]|uniref:Uncharacterized protein n=1 Tax=Ascoidea rubescens DSM 1968 TaxID=1344418 RepID=A0A1D2VSG4_9ASCO|nr:hypothetical protein ASCRUDRAFT_106142 [Ascoidea rubescens DSM 1968]ODV64540.1 hypothetical protein ASCRUDRAFT_106142 [Ascoidea rubescens DSM 1968]